jgi:hypothetical protein
MTKYGVDDRNILLTFQRAFCQGIKPARNTLTHVRSADDSVTQNSFSERTTAILILMTIYFKAAFGFRNVCNFHTWLTIHF